MLRATSLRVLDDRDLPDALGLLARDVVGNVFVASRVESAGLDPWRLGAEVWGHAGPAGQPGQLRHAGRDAPGELDALCYSGANLVPVGADQDSAKAFAERARRQGRRCSSIVGPAGAVEVMWHHLHPHWGVARDIREDQPLMSISGPPQVAPDTSVRRVSPAEVDVLLPACVAMFSEEVGVTPLAGDGGRLYRTRVAELVDAGHAFARIENGQVLFKAEIGAAAAAACQIQGVWVSPDLRGRGLGTAGTAAVVAAALESIAPVVSLYVNDYNLAARTAYERVGFCRVGTFMSVLF